MRAVGGAGSEGGEVMEDSQGRGVLGRRKELPGEWLGHAWAL